MAEGGPSQRPAAAGGFPESNSSTSPSTIRRRRVACDGFGTEEGPQVTCSHCGTRYLDILERDNPLRVCHECSSCSSSMTCKRKPPKQPKLKSSSILEPHSYTDNQQSSYQTTDYHVAVLISSATTDYDELLYFGRSRDVNTSAAVLPITPEYYQYEIQRIWSFVRWPLWEVVHPVQLACVGFVYTGKGTLVQCFQCGIKCRDWDRKTSPFVVHYTLNRRCPFVKTFMTQLGLSHLQASTTSRNNQAASIPSSSCKPKMFTRQSAIPEQMSSSLSGWRQQQQKEINEPIEAERKEISSKHPTVCDPPSPPSTISLHHVTGHSTLAAFPDDSLPHLMSQLQLENKGSIDPFTCDTHSEIPLDPPQRAPQINQSVHPMDHDQADIPIHNILKPLTVHYNSQMVSLNCVECFLVNTHLTGQRSKEQQCCTIVYQFIQ